MSKRLTGVLLATAILFVGLFGRLYGLSVSSLKSASMQQSTRTQILYKTRGTIYDRYLQPLVNADTQWAVSVYPYADVLQQSDTVLTVAEREAVREAMERGHRASFLRETALPFHETVVQSEVPIRYADEPIAVHLIGYVDGEYQGVCGIEQGYEEVLRLFSGEFGVSYAIDALGRPSSATVDRTINTVARSKGGVVLTLDTQIQRIVEECMASIEAGVIIVSDVKNAQVLAVAGAPEYDPNCVELSLEEADSPLMNRTLCLYNIGSVFKTVVAAAALENGYGIDTAFPCDGSISVNGVTFGCREHGDKTVLNMAEAMTVSCNAYFIQLASTVGAQAIEDMAARAGWKVPLTVANGIQTQTPTFPTVTALAVDATLANTAIGQGELLASAYHVHSWMDAVARDGAWTEPTVYMGQTDGVGNVTEKEQPSSVPLFSADTAASLRSMLTGVVVQGTGMSAAPSYGSAFGKTGTAESGWTMDGEEIIQSWFSGCYPAERPQYVITVLSENGGQNGRTAAPVFATVCDRLFEAGLVEFSAEMY